MKTVVAARVPMKRELKGPAGNLGGVPGPSCSPCPYEEGTESKEFRILVDIFHQVAARVPMKRELKDLRMLFEPDVII